MKNLKNKALVALGTISSGAMMLPVIVKADEPDLSGVLSTAVTGVKTDFMKYASTVIPVALGIAGVVLAISLGWKLFKKFTH